MEHEWCHAAYAFYGSPIRDDQTLIATHDGWGDDLSGTLSIYSKEKNQIERIKEYNHKDFQLARIYRYTTLVLRMLSNEHEYKVMGLASYYNGPMIKNVEKVFDNMLSLDGLDFKFNKNIKDIYNYLKQNHPELVKDEYFRPHDTAVIEIPQSAPKGSIIRTESPFDLLKRVKQVANEWVKPGHRKGSNTHNVSATISLKEGEWDKAGKWMWDNRDCYNGLSVLPFDGGTYTQAPFEDITKEEFEKLVSKLHEVNLEHVSEETDNTDLSGELACAGGSCEITSL